MSKHLTQQQRYYIEAYKKAGYGNSEIAKDLGVHSSTIGRELKSNSSPIRQRYGAKVAQEISSLRKSANSKVNRKLKMNWKIFLSNIFKEAGRRNRYLQLSALNMIYHSLL